MRIVPDKILTVLVVTFTNVAFARDAPPPPSSPGPPGLPIDNGVLFLFVAAIAFGLYKIYQFKLNKKTLM